MSTIQILESDISMPLMRLKFDSHIVSTGSHRILFNPHPNPQILEAQKDELGPVTDIVSPTGFHSGGGKTAHQFFPDAKIWASPGLKAKWESSPDNYALLSTETWPYLDDLLIFPLKGMPDLQEVVFYHKPTKTLLVSDLCFNLLNQKGFGSWLLLSIFGTRNKFGISRLFVRFIKNKAEFLESLRPVFTLDFETILMTHGKPIKSDARSSLIQVLKKRGLDPGIS